MSNGISSELSRPERAIFFLVIALAATVSGYFGIQNALGQQPEGAERIIVADPSDQRISGIVSELRGRGFETAINAQQLQARVGPGTRTVILSREAFRAAPAAILRALYRDGVAIVGLDLDMNELRNKVPELGDPRRPTPPEAPAPSLWLPTLSDYLLFSIIREAREGTYTALSETSDIFRNTETFLALVNRAEQLEARPSSTPSVPPSN